MSGEQKVQTNVEHFSKDNKLMSVRAACPKCKTGSLIDEVVKLDGKQYIQCVLCHTIWEVKNYGMEVIKEKV